ncbi:MAG: polysaccharide export protein [Candidatus Cloacimonetes bacterium]|nr:polysaccharide export protein [Candidatus Cloacimonadota bacterium]
MKTGFATVLMVLLHICASANPWVKEETIKPGEFNLVYTIGPRDGLEITVQGLKEFERKGLMDELIFLVTDDGFVNLPLVGLIKAQGRTATDLTRELEKAYTKFVTKPQISVVVRSFKSKQVYVLGKVFQNGAIPLKHDKTTLFEVLAEAGGFSSKIPSIDGVVLNEPDMRNVYVIRSNKKYIINLYDQLIQKTDDTPFIVHPEDRIFVPEPVEVISVLGGVKKAGAFNLKSGLTLLQAIALAGSFTENARRDNVQVIRKGASEATRVNAVRIFDGREKDLDLKSGDIIYVAEW